MGKSPFPVLDAQRYSGTRDALHAYSRILGGWAKACRTRRKHWWHASLRPSLAGVTTGVIYADVDFEIELNFRASALQVSTAVGESMQAELTGQPAGELATRVGEFLESVGVSLRPDATASQLDSAQSFSGYSPMEADGLARALSAVSAALTDFRAGVPEETSPSLLLRHRVSLA